MRKWLFPMLLVILMIPSIAASETQEEFEKKKAAAEAADEMIPKGGPKLIPKDVIIEGLRNECQVTFQSDSVLFDYGLPKIKEESYPQVEEIAKALKQAFGDPTLSRIRTYYVDGHTCSIGTVERNCRLSWARSHSVIEELVKRGIPRERLVPRGYGQACPAHSNETEDTRRLNRRTVLKADCRQGVAQNDPIPCRMTSDEGGGYGEGYREQPAPAVPVPPPVAGADSTEADPKGKAPSSSRGLPRGSNVETQGIPKSPFPAAIPGQSGLEQKGAPLPQGFKQIK